jgi:hypothetical protein
VYAEELTKAGFKVNWFYQVNEAAEAKYVLEKLTEVLPDPEIKQDKDRVIMYNQRKVRVGEGDSLLISRDSIGHIMLSSRDPLLVTNTVSAIKSRRDNVPLIGFDEWLEIEQISIAQLQRNSVSMLAYNYMDMKSELFADLKRKHVINFGTLPSQLTYHAYEMMVFFGHVFNDYGIDFKNALHNNGYRPGRLFAGFDYSYSNDNLVMPIVEIVNFEMVPAKRQSKLIQEEEN